MVLCKNCHAEVHQEEREKKKLSKKKTKKKDALGLRYGGLGF